MIYVTGDFETYYDTEYSLSRLTTEEYIRDRRFEVVGLSIKVQDSTTRWFTGDHAYIKRKLAAIPWEQTAFIAHNARFDAAILSWIFDIHPKAIIDTLSMARAMLGPAARVSLSAVSEALGIGEKGKEVVLARGLRRTQFPVQQLKEYGGYCKNDTELCWKIYQTFIARGFPLSELKLIDLTIRMFTNPVLELDKNLLVQHLADLKLDKKQMLVDTMRAMGRDDLAGLIILESAEGLMQAQKMLRSDAQFAEMLNKLGVDAPEKVSVKTGKMKFAFAKTDDGFKELLEHEDVRVQTVAAARVGVKTTIEESRTERFLGIASRGLLPVPLRYYAAHTGRWGGDDKINIQNLSARGKHGKKLKRTIKAPPGHVVIDADSSQIEARVLAWFAGQDDLVEAFRLKRDVYSEMASTIYRRHVDRKATAIDENGKEFHPDEREGFVGKTAVLGCGFGMGGARFKIQLRAQTSIVLPVEETTRIVKVYRAKYPNIPKLWKTAQTMLDVIHARQSAAFGINGLLKVNGAGIQLPNGLYIQYPQLHKQAREEGSMGFDPYEYVYKSREGMTRIFGPKVVENVIQALARLIVAHQMLLIARRYTPRMTTHDSIGVVVPIPEAHAAQAYIEHCMKQVPPWAAGLPVTCESNIGASYGDC